MGVEESFFQCVCGRMFLNFWLNYSNQRREHLMSIVILGGNECMERRYKDLCDSYRCQSKIFTKPGGGLRKKWAEPI